MAHNSDQKHECSDGRKANYGQAQRGKELHEIAKAFTGETFSWYDGKDFWDNVHVRHKRSKLGRPFDERKAVDGNCQSRAVIKVRGNLCVRVEAVAHQCIGSRREVSW